MSWSGIRSGPVRSTGSGVPIRSGPVRFRKSRSGRLLIWILETISYSIYILLIAIQIKVRVSQVILKWNLWISEKIYEIYESQKKSMKSMILSEQSYVSYSAWCTQGGEQTRPKGLQQDVTITIDQRSVRGTPTAGTDFGKKYFSLAYMYIMSIKNCCFYLFRLILSNFLFFFWKIWKSDVSMKNMEKYVPKSMKSMKYMKSEVSAPWTPWIIGAK